MIKSVCFLFALIFLLIPVNSGAQEWTAADTGRMAPLHPRDFSRYTPGMCISMITSHTNSIWRRREADTAERKPTQDTLPTAVIAAANECASQFTVENLNPVDLRNIHNLAILIGNANLEKTAMERRLALSAADTGRGEILLQAIETHLEARPVRFPVINSLLMRLDSLGAGAAVARVLAHHAYAMLSLNLTFDTVTARREIETIKTFRHHLTSNELSEFVYQASTIGPATQIAWYRVSDTTLPAVLDTIFQEGMDAVSEQGKVVVAAMRLALESAARSVGRMAPPLKGTHWFNKPDSGTYYPQPGKVTLIAGLGSESMYRLALLRRLHEKYSASGLEIVIVAETDGFSWASPPQSVEDEVHSIAWYYLEQLKLPFTLMVDTTSYITDATGKRERLSTDFSMQYTGPGGARGLIGRDGRIRSVTIGTNIPEVQVEAFIRQALGK